MGEAAVEEGDEATVVRKRHSFDGDRERARAALACCERVRACKYSVNEFEGAREGATGLERRTPATVAAPPPPPPTAEKKKKILCLPYKSINHAPSKCDQINVYALFFAAAFFAA
jgi:hypothetical protein